MTPHPGRWGARLEDRSLRLSTRSGSVLTTPRERPWLAVSYAACQGQAQGHAEDESGAKTTDIAHWKESNTCVCPFLLPVGPLPDLAITAGCGLRALVPVAARVILRAPRPIARATD